MNNYTVLRSHRNVIKVKFKGVRKGWEQWVMLSADRHHDNIRTNQDLELTHLKKAKERGALILDFGDLFCAMQGKYDPRSSMDDLRPEHKSAKYLDVLVSTAADFYKPFAKNFLLISHGNHETNVLKRHGTDLTSNLIARMNDFGGNVFHGIYGGWVKFQFLSGKGSAKNLKYHHGAGGGGPVTRGTIQSNRQAVYLPDADIVVNGHTHDAWVLPIKRERLSNHGFPSGDIQYHVRTPGYKNDYLDGGDGFHIEKWGAPKPLGCIWLRFYVVERSRGPIIGIDLTPDVQ